MKLKPTLLAAFLMTLAASSATIFATDMQSANSNADTPMAENSVAKKEMKKHSHMTEKTGIPAEAVTGKSHRESMDKDMPMHDHAKERR